MEVSPRERAVPAQQSSLEPWTQAVESPLQCSERIGDYFQEFSSHHKTMSGVTESSQHGGAVLAELRRAGPGRADCTGVTS